MAQAGAIAITFPGQVPTVGISFVTGSSSPGVPGSVNSVDGIGPVGGNVSLPSDSASGASKRSLGVGALQAASGADSRFTDARVPIAGSVGLTSINNSLLNPASGPGLRTVGTTPGTVAAGDDTRFNVTSPPSDPVPTTAGLRTLGTGHQQAAAGDDSRFNVTSPPIDPAPNVGGLRTLGVGAQQAAAGNDSRFTAPPTDPVPNTAGLRTLGTGAQQAAAGNDSRFSNIPPGGVDSTKAGFPTLGCYFGAFADSKPGGGSAYPTYIAALEAQMGASRVFGAHRVFMTPGQAMNPDNIAGVLQDDANPAHLRTTFLSMKTPTGQTWASMATKVGNGQTLTTCAQKLGAYTHPIVACVHHECDVGTLAGTPGFLPSDYSDFCTAFFHELATYAPNVTTIIIFGGYRLAFGGWTTGDYLPFLPQGSELALLDMIGVDPYNYRNSAAPGATGLGGTGGVEPTYTFQALTEPMADFAKFLGKALAVCEAGCSWESGAREDWWTKGLAWTKTRSEIKAIMAWNSDAGIAAQGITTVGNHNMYLDDTVSLLNVIKSNTIGTGQTYFKPKVVGTTTGTTGAVQSIDFQDGNGPVVGLVKAPINQPGGIPSARTLDDSGNGAAQYRLGLTVVGQLPVLAYFGSPGPATPIVRSSLAPPAGSDLVLESDVLDNYQFKWSDRLAIARFTIATLTGQVADLINRVTDLEGGPPVIQGQLPPAGADPIGTRAYTIPNANVIYVSTTGSDANNGTTTSLPVRTFWKAHQLVPVGGTIVARGGTYHEGAYSAYKQCTIMNYPNEAVWIDGSVLISTPGAGNQNLTVPNATTDPPAGNGVNTSVGNMGTSAWVLHSGVAGSTGIYRKDGIVLPFDLTMTNGTWTDASGGTQGPQATSLYPTANQPFLLFANGVQLTQRWTLTGANGLNGPNQFYFNQAAHQLFVYGDPGAKTMELSIHQWFVDTNNTSSTIKGIGFRRFATSCIQFGVVRGTGTNFTVEHCRFDDCALEGLFTHVKPGIVKNCTFTQCGKAGATHASCSGQNLQYNIYDGNNFRHFSTWQEAGGVKLSQCTNANVQGNIFRNNQAAGIWLDVYSNNANIYRNTADNNYVGMYFEISDTAKFVGNLVTNNDYGIQIGTSRNIEIWNNTFMNNTTSQVHLDDSNRNDTGGALAANGTSITLGNVKLFNNVFYNTSSNYHITMNDARGPDVRKWNNDQTPFSTVGNFPSNPNVTGVVGINFTADYNGYWRNAGSQNIAQYLNGAPGLLSFQALSGAGGITTTTLQESHSILQSVGNADRLVDSLGSPTASAQNKGVALNSGIALLLGIPAGQVCDLGAIQL